MGPKKIFAVARLPIERNFKQEGELAQRLLALIHEYDSEVSLVAVIGCMEVVKAELLAAA